MAFEIEKSSKIAVERIAEINCVVQTISNDAKPGKAGKHRSPIEKRIIGVLGGESISEGRTVLNVHSFEEVFSGEGSDKFRKISEISAVGRGIGIGSISDGEYTFSTHTFEGGIEQEKLKGARRDCVVAELVTEDIASRFLGMPIYLKRTAMAIVALGKASAFEISKKTNRTAEHWMLDRLYREGYIEKEESNKGFIFSFNSQPAQKSFEKPNPRFAEFKEFSNLSDPLEKSLLAVRLLGKCDSTTVAILTGNRPENENMNLRKLHLQGKLSEEKKWKGALFFSEIPDLDSLTSSV